MQGLAPSIIVGVSGEGENVEALRFAADEARLRGTGVTLVHVAQTRRRGSSSDAGQGSVEQHGQRIVDEAGQRLASLAHDEVPTATLVRQGEPGEVLTELSRDATSVVLQHRDHSRLHRLTTGSTVMSVAAHAHSPVVSVPPAHGHPGRGVVTVGVHEDGGPADVVETAFAEAALHGWTVHMIYAWRVSSAYGDMVAEEDHWTAEAQASLAAATDEVRRKYAGVSVTVDVRHDHPADALVKMSTESSLLVVGRHSHHGFLQPRLGSLARTSIAHAECPVMIVSL
jgi:nucleotide-binding universal stress UspA family protein